jgi:hypothetical protein
MDVLCNEHILGRCNLTQDGAGVLAILRVPYARGKTMNQRGILFTKLKGRQNDLTGTTPGLIGGLDSLLATRA